MKRHGSIYKITKLDDNFSYIGKTTRPTVKDRFNDHYWKTSSKMYIDLAMRKYGRTAFNVEELFVAFDDITLNKAERELVEKYNTLWPNGFNLKEGGHGNTKHTEEAKRRIKDSLIGVKNPGHTGHKHKESIKKLLSEKNGGQIIVAISLDKSKVQYFMTSGEAATYGFNQSNVINICKNRGKRKIDHGFNFMYYSDYANQSGSAENKNSEHAQRIGSEPAI